MDNLVEDLEVESYTECHALGHLTQEVGNGFTLVC